jgi:hypothetical protein
MGGNGLQITMAFCKIQTHESCEWAATWNCSTMNVGDHTFAAKNYSTHNQLEGQFKLKLIDADIVNRDVLLNKLIVWCLNPP